MSIRKKFTRTTFGRGAQKFVTVPFALSTQATEILFVANETQVGRIGIYDQAGAVRSLVLAATDSFKILQERSSGNIKRSTELLRSNCTITRRSYVAPVLCTGSIGWSGATGDLNIATPVVGNTYEVGILETTEGNQPFPAWNYEYQTKSGDAPQDIVQGLARSVNDVSNLIYKQNDRLVRATCKAQGTYGNLALGGTAPTLTVTAGSAIVTFGGTTPTLDAAVGDFISISNTAAPTNLIGDVYKVVAISATNITLGRVFTGTTQVFTQAEAQGTRVNRVTTITRSGIVFNALGIEEHFRILARQLLINSDILNLTTYVKGNGTTEQVQELEMEGLIYDGNTASNTQYGDPAFGNPDRFSFTNAVTETYDIFTIVATQRSQFTSAMVVDMLPLQIILAVPRSSGGITAALNTIFGT